MYFIIVNFLKKMSLSSFINLIRFINSVLKKFMTQFPSEILCVLIENVKKFVRV